MHYVHQFLVCDVCLEKLDKWKRSEFVDLMGISESTFSSISSAAILVVAFRMGVFGCLPSPRRIEESNDRHLEQDWPTVETM